MLKVCISGLGRTGCQIAKYFLNSKQVKLVSAVCSPSSWKAGRDLGEVIGCFNTGIPVYSSSHLEQCIFNTKPDVVMDFSQPFAALKNAEIFLSLGVKIVMGTTGFSNSEENMLFELAEENSGGIIYAPNITRGVNVLMLLAELASKILENYDVEIVEMHHKSKKDSPSGTALKIAEGIRNGRNEGLNQVLSNISISSVRAGGMMSCHKVMLVGENDMLEITHQSFSRDAFAEGALYALEFICDRTGVYEMKDALNCESILEDHLNYAKEFAQHQIKI